MQEAKGKGGWYVSIPATVSDTRKRAKRFFTSKAEAMAFEAEVEALKATKRRLGVTQVARKTPWKQAVRRTESLRWSNLQDPVTPSQRASGVFQAIGKDTLEECTREDFWGYRKAREEAGVRPSTINKELSAVSAVFKTLQDESKEDLGFPKLPFIPKKQAERKAAQRRFLEREEMEQAMGFLRSLDNLRDIEAAAFFETSYYIGCRRGEFLKAQVRDVNLKEKTITFRQTKTGEIRTIPLAPRAVAVLTPIILNRGSECLIWGLTKDQLRHAWDKARSHMGWPSDNTVVPYSLRHGLATEILRRTGDLRAVQQWLGHSDISTTTIYAKVVPGTLKAIAEDL